MQKRMFFCLLATLLFTVLASAQDQRELDYRRERVKRAAPTRAQRGALPENLVYRKTPTRHVHSGSRGNSPEANIVIQAEQAAAWSARERAQIDGSREYYQLGFYTSLRQVLDTPHYAEWDRREGQRSGRHNRWAGRDGAALGAEISEELAKNNATEEISAQFHDLSWRPIPEPRRGRVQAPDFRGRFNAFVKPSLKVVFNNLPLRTFSDWRGRNSHFHEHWQINPWKLYKAKSSHKFYNDHWRDKSHAFENWRKDERRARYYNSLGHEERGRFRGIFNEAFPDAVAAVYHQYNQPAYDMGWDDGWDYGLHLAYEWGYRQGYYEGAEQAAIQSAEDAFFSTYSRTYHRIYEKTFSEWKNNPKLEINDVFTADANDNGVFEPGETITVGFELTNYGGQGADLDTRLDGPVLIRTGRDKVHVEPRERTRVGHAVGAVLDENAALKLNHPLRLSVGSLQERFDIRVARPLQFITDFNILERNNLEGYARLEIGLENISTKPVRGATFFNELERLNLETLGPGEIWRHSFEVSGKRALDMVGGRASFELEAAVGSTRHDRVVYAFPEVVTNLENGDLVAILVDLANEFGASDTDVDFATRLIVKRMSEDWRQVVEQGGNPYKHDRKKGGDRTALGELVLAFKRERGRLENPKIFTRLRPILIGLCGDLPGAHPFLRKHFKKLVGQLK